MTCDKCKYFNTSENYRRSEGWCELELPVWLYAALNTMQYDLETKVKGHDTCSFFKEQE